MDERAWADYEVIRRGRDGAVTVLAFTGDRGRAYRLARALQRRCGGDHDVRAAPSARQRREHGDG